MGKFICVLVQHLNFAGCLFQLILQYYEPWLFDCLQLPLEMQQQLQARIQELEAQVQGLD